MYRLTCLFDLCICGGHLLVVISFLFLNRRTTVNIILAYEIQSLTASLLNHFFTSVLTESYSLSATFPNLASTSASASNSVALVYIAFTERTQTARQQHTARHSTARKQRTSNLPGPLHPRRLAQRLRQALLQRADGTNCLAVLVEYAQ